MGRISANDADKYGSELSGEWFSLKNDKDCAKVQFMYDSFDELDVFATHKLEVNGKDRHINCLREYGDPIENCPLCEAGFAPKAAMFVLMYQHDDNKVKIWERGKKFRQKLESLFNLYKPLSDFVFNIERLGKPNDKQTAYEVNYVPIDAYDLSEIERPELLGGIILDKDYGDLQYFLETGEFPDDTAEAAPPQAPPRRQAPAQQQAAPPASRRQAPAQAPATTQAPPSRRQPPRTGKETF